VTLRRRFKASVSVSVSGVLEHHCTSGQCHVNWPLGVVRRESLPTPAFGSPDFQQAAMRTGCLKIIRHSLTGRRRWVEGRRRWVETGAETEPD
jgi:hypothetical protein